MIWWWLVAAYFSVGYSAFQIVEPPAGGNLEVGDMQNPKTIYISVNSTKDEIKGFKVFLNSRELIFVPESVFYKGSYYINGPAKFPLDLKSKNELLVQGISDTGTIFNAYESVNVIVGSMTTKFSEIDNLQLSILKIDNLWN
jgi:hypothetical protein